MKLSATCLQLSALLIAGCASASKPASVSGVVEPWKEYSLNVAGSRRTYELVWPNNARTPLPVLFFLHGLDSDLPNPDLTAQHYRFLAQKAHAAGFLAVFPRGLRGANPQLPGSLAWIGNPAKERANREFLLALLADLSKRYAVDRMRVVLGGFSNGGYLAGKELLEHPEGPFTGFWIEDAGTWGELPAFESREKRAPVYLSLATDDWLNYKKGKDLLARLLAKGWELGKTLKMNEHGGGTDLDRSGFETAWSFLAARNS